MFACTQVASIRSVPEFLLYINFDFLMELRLCLPGIFFLAAGFSCWLGYLFNNITIFLGICYWKCVSSEAQNNAFAWNLLKARKCWKYGFATMLFITSRMFRPHTCPSMLGFVKSFCGISDFFLKILPFQSKFPLPHALMSCKAIYF